MYFRATLVAVVLAASSLAAAIPLTRRANVGDGTFFTPGLGACGIQNSDADSIVAISSSLFQQMLGGLTNPNANPVCNRQISASFQGKTVIATVVDSCPGCAEFDLDFSPAAFNQLADPSVGRISGVTWDFI